MDPIDLSLPAPWTQRRRLVTERTEDPRLPFKVRLKGHRQVAGLGATEAEAMRNARLSWELGRLARQR
ncbi:hypothetical protein [uncultured Aquincola sp.]|uniref:hypothetical protein n=1 Tax=uncultured Aquincola sp. TaxID=886556 RepID=UPI0032B26069